MERDEDAGRPIRVVRYDDLKEMSSLAMPGEAAPSESRDIVAQRSGRAAGQHASTLYPVRPPLLPRRAYECCQSVPTQVVEGQGCARLRADIAVVGQRREQRPRDPPDVSLDLLGRYAYELRDAEAVAYVTCRGRVVAIAPEDHADREAKPLLRETDVGEDVHAADHARDRGDPSQVPAEQGRQPLAQLI